MYFCNVIQISENRYYGFTFDNTFSGFKFNTEVVDSDKKLDMGEVILCADISGELVDLEGECSLMELHKIQLNEFCNNENFMGILRRIRSYNLLIEISNSVLVFQHAYEKVNFESCNKIVKVLCKKFNKYADSIIDSQRAVLLRMRESKGLDCTAYHEDQALIVISYVACILGILPYVGVSDLDVGSAVHMYLETLEVKDQAKLLLHLKENREELDKRIGTNYITLQKTKLIGGNVND